MGLFSLANLFGITLRESANDGSDFTNPDADYRRVFLGEDGALHAKDSAGTVTTLGGLADQGTITYLDATEAAAPSSPAAGKVRLYAKSDGLLYSKDDAGVETVVTGGGGGGGGNVGNVLSVVPDAVNLHTSSGNFAPAADTAWAMPVHVPAPMYVRGLVFNVATGGSGSLEWGVFDFSASVTAATKLAGGSAAPGGTGWRTIAATGAPDLIDGGDYMLIWKQPSANGSTLVYSTPTTASRPAVIKVFATYTWDDTPDLTNAGWVLDSGGVYQVYLRGDLNATTQW